LSLRQPLSLRSNALSPFIKTAREITPSGRKMQVRCQILESTA
jgi:hypothetical protein